ncbi:hypothetical protein SuNHUV7_32220 (plasmid) [Pseudoseohaeicola sp. NH-UV-7]
MESDANPMRLVELMNNAPRCLARSKCTGARCKGPAMLSFTVTKFDDCFVPHVRHTSQPQRTSGPGESSRLEPKLRISGCERLLNATNRPSEKNSRMIALSPKCIMLHNF